MNHFFLQPRSPFTLFGALRAGFEAEGYEVDTAATGSEAEERLTRPGFDAVVLDWMLPGLSLKGKGEKSSHR